jgi:hypothetical protein
MATVNIAYGSETSLTWAGAIASSTTAGRQSNTIDNTSTLADDYEVAVNIVFPNSAPANDKTVYVYAAGYIGATNTWAGRPALTGSDGSYTANDITTTPMGVPLAGAFFMVQNTTGTFLIPSLATVFGGSLPQKIALVVMNYSGQTITTFTATYRAITYTVA